MIYLPSSIVVVDVQDGAQNVGTSVAFIFDDPDARDRTGPDDKMQTTITCTGDCPNYPNKAYFAVKDDPNDVNNRFSNTNGYPVINFKWDSLKTDGAATQPASAPFRFCIETKTVGWPDAEKFNVFDGYNKMELGSLSPTAGDFSPEICIDYGVCDPTTRSKFMLDRIHVHLPLFGSTNLH